MNILIVGGTRFQGRYLVQELLDRKHNITVFHRGGHAIDARYGLTDLIGDRNVRSDLAVLTDQRFDACIDTCAYFPGQVDLLASAIDARHYCLVSSVYAYADRDALLDENAPLDNSPVDPGASLTPQNYGALKTQCEERANWHFGNACLIVRPSIIVGPGDHTGRMSFWMRMTALHHKRIEVVGRDPTVQFVDVRDLARFIASSVEAGRHGPVNVCGAETRFQDVLGQISEVSGSECDLRTTTEDALFRLGLSGLPYLDGDRRGRYNIRTSIAWGFSARSLRESLRDIHAHEQRCGFATQAFQAEETAILGLFS